MESSIDILDLSSIGKELDNARKSRISTNVPDLVTVPESQSESESDLDVDSDSVDTTSIVSSPPSARISLPTSIDDEVQPAPTCLLCFTRPPSAVLLPCCHLNLCYLCAPLLLLKQCRLPLATSPPDRIPFNIALTRAMANHPKSRRLSSGGPPIPEAGERGSELQAGDIEAACESDGLGSGLKGEKGEDGRIQLSCNEEGGARCLICRTGVSGWLRVYT